MSFSCTARSPASTSDSGIGIGARNSPDVVMRPRMGSFDVKYRMPSGPWTMSDKLQNEQLTGNSVMSPAGVIRLIAGDSSTESRLPSTNQRLPSEPLVMLL